MENRLTKNRGGFRGAGQRCKRGPRAQAIGRSRGGPTTKIHALGDEYGQPVAFRLTGGKISEFEDAEALLPLLPANGIVHGDKGYDSNKFREAIQAAGSFPNIPPRKTRKWKNYFSPHICRGRNVIEPCLVGSKSSEDWLPDMIETSKTLWLQFRSQQS